MHFAVLGSGSAGNATVLRRGDEALLIDCGLSVRQLEQRMALVDSSPGMLVAILITHEHDDHVAGAATLSRKYGIPIITSHGTHAAARERLANAHGVETLRADHGFEFGAFQVQPVLVPHDAREPCQFVISDGESRFGMLTDLGHVTPHVLREFGALDALVLEFNHEPALLATSVYPQFLKERIAGPHGHLGNDAAAALLDRLDCSRLHTLVAAHLSEKNNRVGLVAHYLHAHAPAAVQCLIAGQHAPLPWLSVARAEGHAARPAVGR